jgi:hypothetical protein
MRFTMDIRRLDAGNRVAEVRASDKGHPSWDAATAMPRVERLSSFTFTGATPPLRQDCFRRIEDRQFLEMDQIYGLHGGLDSGNAVAGRMRHHWEQPISTLAKWIVGREVVSFVWQSRIQVPMFQFTHADMRVRRVVRAVLGELREVFDDWEIAEWFVHPNVFLRGERPVRLVDIDEAGLLQAARADRFEARG